MKEHPLKKKKYSQLLSAALVIWKRIAFWLMHLEKGTDDA